MSTEHPADLPPLLSLLEEAFREGFTSPETYNDMLENSADECWEKQRDYYSNQLAALAQAQPSLTDERAAFEKFIAKDCGDLSTFGTGANMHYKNSHVESAWIGWKRCAAIATQAAQPEQANGYGPKLIAQASGFAQTEQAQGVPEWFDAPFITEGIQSFGLTSPTPRQFGETISRRYAKRVAELEAALAAAPQAAPQQAEPLGKMVVVRTNHDGNVIDTSRVQNNPKVAQICAEEWRKVWVPSIFSVDVVDVFTHGIGTKGAK